MAEVNRKIVLARRPEGELSLDLFRVEEEPVADVAEGLVQVGVETLSVDAFIRTTLEEGAYHGTVPIGGTVSALGVGRVQASGSPDFAVGDAVFAPTGAQTRAPLPAGMLVKVDDSLAPLRAWLGVLGMTTGLTAYFGIREVGAVRPDDTVVVSAAAGAVGSVAVQLARIEGGRVIGIAGGPAKTSYVTDELGADGAIDYKNEDVAARLRELAPDGVDVFFDNVGGEQLDIVLDQIRERARIVICGAISQYDHMDAVKGPSLYLRLAERHARMEGFAVTHFEDRFAEAGAQLAAWLGEGRLAMREQVVKGIDQFPQALLDLFSGSHIGKLLVEI